jgi:flavin-dependent dehydrogenase
MRATDYDVAVIGGAFSGSAFATLLQRWLPDAKILLIERSERFDRKVGEATVEISSMMLHRVLGLSHELARHHIPKHGLRYWFADGPDCPLSEMSEVGPSEVPRLPAFQLDRSKIDQTLIELAQSAGVEVQRPVSVEELELGWPQSTLTLSAAGDGDSQEGRSVTARWVVDASGRHAFIARRKGLLHRTEEHPTAAFWGRWTGVKDLDGVEVIGTDPRAPKLPPICASRRQATNHFCGHGWWCWMIPLGGGETSVGLVYDKRIFQWPTEGPALERYRQFVTSWPGLRELLAGATLDEEDFRSYAHLPYRSEQYADRGWALVGDAAAFIDPWYSPGLDHASLSAYATARVIEDDLNGKLADDGALEAALTVHNDQFARSYHRWLNALYIDKYELMGDAELTGASFLLDTGLYYVGVVTPLDEDIEEMRYPLFGKDLWQTAAAFRFMQFYNRRLVKLARLRQAYGCYGRRNRGWRSLEKTATVGRTGSNGMIAAGIKLWLKAELHGLGLRLSGKPKATATTGDAAAARPAGVPKAAPAGVKAAAATRVEPAI